MNTRTVGNVIKDRFGKRAGFLEHHSYSGPERYNVDTWGIDVVVIQPDITVNATAAYGVIHPVEAAEKC